MVPLSGAGQAPGPWHFMQLRSKSTFPCERAAGRPAPATFGTGGAKARGEDGRLLCGARSTTAKIMTTSAAPAIAATLTRYSPPNDGNAANKRNRLSMKLPNGSPPQLPTAISRIPISASVKFGHVDFHPPSRYLFPGIRANPAVFFLCRPLLFFPAIPPEKQGTARIPAQFR